MRLGAFIWPFGHHIAAWRHPTTPQNAANDFPHYIELAKTAERGLFDMLFVADTTGLISTDRESLSHASYVAWMEPITLMSALSVVTKHIGLACTASTSYDQPYHIARRFGSLDIISGGRAAWNLITTANPLEASNFSRDPHPDKDVRYRRAREFVHVVKGLWESWDDAAFIRDKPSGRYFDPDKLHILDHKGEFFSVRGPLNVARSKQGHPVMVQAGASDDGRDLAAETAEVVFTAHQSLESAQSFYADLKRRTAGFGRNPEHIKIMPGFFVTVGRTEQEARDKFARIQDLILPDVGVRLLSTFINFDLTGYPIDGPLPNIPDSKVSASRRALITDIARRNHLTIRQLYTHIAGGRGHFQFVGTPAQVADEMQRWFENGAADGFNVMPPILPNGLDDFVEMVIPELQRRGLFRIAYQGTTLRENLGLPWPTPRHASAVPASRPAAALG
jgi:FMN-dependent oxidoreductase (nitrilotriacetate monooxygenase family)